MSSMPTRFLSTMGVPHHPTILRTTRMLMMMMERMVKKTSSPSLTNPMKATLMLKLLVEIRKVNQWRVRASSLPMCTLRPSMIQAWTQVPKMVSYNYSLNVFDIV